jgi:hypothetical protein
MGLGVGAVLREQGGMPGGLWEAIHSVCSLRYHSRSREQGQLALVTHLKSHLGWGKGQVSELLAPFLSLFPPEAHGGPMC